MVPIFAHKIMATIRLWLRLDKIGKDGFAPIHLIYQLHGKKNCHSINIKLRPENWDIETQTAIYVLSTDESIEYPSLSDIKKINKSLIEIKKEIAENGVLPSSRVERVKESIDKLTQHELMQVGEYVDLKLKTISKQL